MSIQIKRAEISDAKLLSELSTKTFVEAFGHTCPKEDMDQFVTKFYSIDTILKEIADSNDFYFIAFDDSNAVGYMRLKEDYSDYPNIKKYAALELKRIYVDATYQSKNIGGSLIQFAIDFALSNKFEAIWLGVWEHNLRAKVFYEKWGFVDTGCSHPFFIGDTPSVDNWFLKVL